VTDEQQLAWERRFAPRAAMAAFGAVVLQIASFAIQLPAISDAPSADDPLRYRETLLNFNAHSSVLLGSGIANALGLLFASGALYYLFRATRHRRRELPQFVQWLVVIAPVLLAVAVVANWVGLKDASDRYSDPSEVSSVRATPTDDQRSDIREFCRTELPRASRTPARLAACRTTRLRQEAVAKKLVDDSRGVVGTAAGFAGTLAIAFSYVIIALNAMRAGLLSRFMGVLGIGVGALIVLPLLPQGLPIVQMFWLGALGALFLGRWSGGRGPAWDTGTAEPWPAATRRGQAEPPPEPESPPAEEKQVARRSSRKRKRKRR
jgi:hypothetical protein